MLIRVIGEGSSFQSDLDFYLKVTDMGSIPNIEDLRKEMFKSFAENERAVKEEKRKSIWNTGIKKLETGNSILEEGNARVGEGINEYVSEQKEEGYSIESGNTDLDNRNKFSSDVEAKVEASPKDDSSNQINEDSKQLIEEKKEKNKEVALSYDEDGWSYYDKSAGSDEGKLDPFDVLDGAVENNSDEEMESNFGEEAENNSDEEVEIDSPEPDNDYEGDFKEFDALDDDDLFPEENYEEDDDTFSESPEIDSSDIDDEVEDPFGDPFEDEDTVEDDYESESESDESDERNTIQLGFVTSESKRVNFNVSDDSWRDSSEVGNVENLWGFDTMKEVDDSVAKNFFAGFEKKQAEIKKASGYKKSDLGEMEKIWRQFDTERKQEEKKETQEREVVKETRKEVFEEQVQKAEEKATVDKQEAVAPSTSVNTDRGSYKDVRDFVKKNKNCSVADVLQVFSKKELEKDIRMGRIYQRKDKG